MPWVLKTIILRLIEHWLKNRRQRTKVGDKLSSWDKVISGILQGSVLGPLLFILFIQDLEIKNLHDHEILNKILKYIDNTKIIAKAKTSDDVEKIQDILNEIYDWEQLNNMKWNGEKFVNLRFGKDNLVRYTNSFTPEFNDPIDEPEYIRDLGIYVDVNLNFKKQKATAISKANNKIAWIFRTLECREMMFLRKLW